MSVYVDRIQSWPTRIRCFKEGSCHLWADTEAELHAFAKRLGLKRSWFQEHPRLVHYDLTVARRAKAIELGATERDVKDYFRSVTRPSTDAEGGG